MQIYFFALADAANTTGDGRINILGLLETVIAPSVPYYQPQITLVLKLKAEHAERIVPQPLRLTVWNDKDEILYDSSPIFSLDDVTAKEARGVALLFNLQWLIFPEYGPYRLQVTTLSGDTHVALLNVLPYLESIADPTILIS